MLGAEFIRYGISGAIAFLANAAVYYGLLFAGVPYNIANIASLVTSKVSAYLLNKLWVYRTVCESKKEFLLEMLKYIAARSFTGVIDYFGLVFMVEVLGGDEKLCKPVVMIVVILLNYVIGKVLVFRKKKTTEE